MLAIILITSPVGATIYYVSNTGNDSNAGTSESQAWRSLDKVNSFIPSPGDQVLFKRGGSWIGSITVNASGNSGNPITYGAYGSGEKPAIYGSELISGWSKFSGNIYRASCSSDVTQVFVDGTRMNVARYPNSGYIDITSVATATQFTASNLPSQSSDYYKNAKVHIRSKDWRLETKDVTASSAQSISFDSGLIFALTKGQKFFLNNKLEFLDLPGEWFYDSTTKTVYLWLQSGDSPENHVVRGSTISSGFEMYNRDYITVKDISLLHFKSHAVKTDKCDYLTIDNNTITYCEGSAVYFYPNYVNGINIRNNTIHHIGQTAVMGRCTSSTLSNNQISEVSLFGEIGIAGLGTGNGFSIDGNNNKVQDNRISNVGYNGISFKGENTVVEFNYINSACNTLTDGGGIYTYTGQDISKPGSAGSIIRNNLVLNCMGEYEESSGKYSCNGIYLDEGTHDVTVENNTVAKAGYAAVFFNITSNNILRNNTVFDAPILFLYVKQYLPSSLQNNIFVTANRNGTTAWWKNSHQRIIFQLLGAEGKYDYHTYVSHYNNTSIFDSNGDGQFEPFEKWNSVTGQDVNSTVDCSVLKEGENEVLFYNDTKQVKTINLGSYTYKDVCGKLITGTFTLEPFTSKILVKTNTVSNQNPVINNQSFEIKGSKSANSFIGTVSANDPDEGQTLTYSITQGNESDIFTINESTGEILTNKDIALTKDISYALSVEVTDNAVAPMSATAIVTINFKYIETTFAEYLFEETSGTIVYDSNNKNNGNIINENLKADGANGKGLEFTGSGYITLGQSFSDNVSNEVSLSAWIKPNLSSAGYQGIIMHGGVNTDTYGLYIFPDSKTVGFKTTGTSNAWSSISNVNKLWDGQWHQLTVTYNGTEKIIYLDGEVLITIPSEGNIESGAGYNLLVGAGRDGVAPSLLYKGIIDEARIYNYALTPEQASALYSPVEVVPETVYGSEEITICEGDSYNGWTREGEYKRTLTALNGADSIVTTYLTVNPTYTITEEKTIKEGQSYHEWTKTGTYERTLASVSGCDSTIITYLTVLSPVETYEDVTICEGDSYNGWTTEGEYTKTLTASNGADSLVTTYLIVNPTYTITEEKTIKEGENYLGWTKTGEYQRTLASVSGCDSTIITYLTVLSPVETYEEITICEGDSYNGWTTEGEYTKTLTASNGADSLITTYLTVNPTYTITEEKTIKEGDNYLGWTISGSYQRTLATIYGCDSIVTTNLTVLKSVTTYEDVNICQGESYMGWTTTGVYQRTLEAANGADSLVITNLEVNPVYNITEEITITEGENYLGWTVSGTYQRNLTSISGCDSTVVTILNVVAAQGGDEISVIDKSTQFISLKKGWNIFSSYVIPENVNMDNILEGLKTDGNLIIAKDENGNTYEKLKDGSGWTNNIGNLEKTKGYEIQVNASCVLMIAGSKMELPLNIPLKKGWNIISFPYEGSIDAIQIVQPLINKGTLEKVLDERGKSIEYWRNRGWINSIGNFAGGEGYKVYVNADDVLEISNLYEKTTSVPIETSNTQHFNPQYTENGIDHMNINILNLSETGLTSGDEIAAFDGELCVGKVRLTDRHFIDDAVSVNATSSNKFTEFGFWEGNSIEIKVWKEALDKESISTPTVLDGVNLFKKYASVFLTLNNSASEMVDGFNPIEISVYPNPATTHLTVRLSSIPENGAEMILSDFTGKQIIRRQTTSNYENFDVQGLPAGIYFLKTIIGNDDETKKLVIN
ncbi:MAG: LamG-like jellyroll fold domain-containing protein [Draconibacterium sp.]